MSVPSIDAPEGERTRSSRRRLWSLGIAIGIHLLILALFLVSRPRSHMGQGVGVGAMDLSLAGLGHAAAPSPPLATTAPAPPATPKPPAPPAPPDPIKPRSVLAIVSDILSIPLPEHSVTPTPLVPTPSPVVVQAMAQASSAPGAACDVGGAVQTTLRSDPDTHGAVLLMPRTQGAGANAVVIWNGEWIAPAATDALPALTTIRASIRKVVAAAPAECRDQAIVGPRFMLIPAGDTTVVAVFGDDDWKWSDLLVDADGAISLQKDNPGLNRGL
jgi:hypothetical protein